MEPPGLQSSPVMRRILAFSAIVEAGTGLALVAAPAFVLSLLIGGTVAEGSRPLGRCFGIAILALVMACWPGREPSGGPACISGAAELQRPDCALSHRTRRGRTVDGAAPVAGSRAARFDRVSADFAVATRADEALLRSVAVRSAGSQDRGTRPVYRPVLVARARRKRESRQRVTRAPHAPVCQSLAVAEPLAHNPCFTNAGEQAAHARTELSVARRFIPPYGL